ncbi:MAG: M23 family metallopeptidase [Deltaproteobacteria bacterium]|nr:M23 family metallopeptidase [Deltaproteobacteria bacterium]
MTLRFKAKTLISLSLLSSLVLLIGFPSAASLSLPTSSFVYPLVGTRVSSDYGWRKHPVIKATRHHDGIDLAAPQGALIRAVRSGVVVFSDPYGGYGNLIVVKHSDNMTSHYGHCKEIKVRPGQRVNAGEIIGTVGSTGRVTGPHLHFEIRINGVPENPEALIPGLAVEGQG